MNSQEMNKMLNEMSYETAWRFFSNESENGQIINLYLSSFKSCVTEDLRGGKNTFKRIIDSISGKKSLMLIDGASCTGKSTLASKISKTIDATIIDIDTIYTQWFISHLHNVSIDLDMGDEYILKNLQKIIERASNKGSVILVGKYLNIVHRSIISKTLGQYFEQVVSILMIPKDITELTILVESRNKQTKLTDESINNIVWEYAYSVRMLKDLRNYIGIGMTVSFVVNSV